MSEAIAVNTLEQLKPFLNNKNVIEIITRQKNARIKNIQKVILNSVENKSETSELTKKVVEALNQKSASNKKLRSLNGIIKFQEFSLILNSMNLCATCAGFAIMYNKLSNMEKSIRNGINEIKDGINKGNDIFANFEYGKVLSDHTDMLDSRKKKQPYTESKMRELVDAEYNILNMLIEILQKNASSDKDNIIFSIFSMLAMLTVSLRYFDELYYTNNHNNLEDGNQWHASHDKWMSVYDKLSSNQFVVELQDYAFLDKGFSTVKTDVYYITLLDQVIEQKEEVIDNQKLIVELGKLEVMGAMQSVLNNDVKNTLDQAVNNVCSDIDKKMVDEFKEKIYKQVSLAC